MGMDKSPFFLGNTSSNGPFLNCYVSLPECEFTGVFSGVTSVNSWACMF